MILYFISMLLVFLSYMIMVRYRYGVLASISESYYRLPDGQKILFTLFCWGFTLPAMIISNTLFMFIAGSAICFVGAASAFKLKYVYWVHSIGAIIGVLFALVSIFSYQQYWLGALSLMAMLVVTKFRTRIWWIEIITFTATALSLSVNL